MKRVLIALMCVIAILLTVFATYRIVMHNIQIEVEGGTAFLTVFGQTDYYSLDK